MASAAASLGKLSGCRILVAGDVMLDRYWFGRVDRVSPEAPVPVVTVDQSLSEERLGGAGNVARNITALGARCTLLSVVGDDEAGERIADLAARAGVDAQLVVERGGQTTVKLRAIARNQQLLRADFESAPAAETLAAARAKYTELLGEHQVAVLSDYGKGGLHDCAAWLALAAQHNTPALVDPKGGDFARYRGAALVTPNLAEFEQVAGAVADDDDMRHKANALMRAHDLGQLLVTLSERGMALFSPTPPPHGAVIRSPARAREVYDVSGAGDTVIAMLALARAARLDDLDALALANSAAGVVVSKLGAATADIDELAAALERDGREKQQGKGTSKQS